ncbi:MAG TPA: HAD family hydrolase, partial [Candidatus Limnocylindrales bacterium]|nr:HAD family hydrolase [Candidatus Limnocylindrales bacterium]
LTPPASGERVPTHATIEGVLQIRAVLFDLDGTLLDRRETFRRHLGRQIGRFGDLFGGRSTAEQVERMVALDRNGETPRPQFYEQVEADLGLPGGAAARLHDDFEAHFPETCVATSNAHRTLDRLRSAGLTLGLITNGRVLMQDRKIDRLDVRRFFDVILISEAVGIRKPDPRIFAAALDALGGIAPAAAAYVGDNPEPDVGGARRSGLVAIWKRDAFWPEPADADWTIDDLAELPLLVAAAR